MGGKSAVLRCLFEKLKIEGMAPLYVTFHNHHTLRKDDSAIEALMSRIAVQLAGLPNSTPVIANEEAVLEYLAKSPKPVILLVDELDALSDPITRDLSWFLKTYFLDPQDRYLVYSTRVPYVLDPVDPISGAFGKRVNQMVCLPRCKDVPEMNRLLQSYGSTDTMNDARLTWYGHIPSLVFVDKCAA